LDNGVRGLRIAFCATFAGVVVEPEVAACVQRAAAVLEDLGAIVEPVSLSMHDAEAAMRVLWPVANARNVQNLSPAQRALLDPGLAEMIAASEDVKAIDYLAAVTLRERVQAQMNAVFERFDLLLTPTLPVAAFPVGNAGPHTDDRHILWSGFTYPSNLTMQPASSVPCGFTTEGRPVGMQLVGQRFSDAVVLRTARAYESAVPFRMPPVARDRS
jgi:aspartyl-tRNA(Asn)/glutamyl-tRNA(Gln) amidotransferase subunit A